MSDLPFARRDVSEALPDLLLLRAGVPVAEPHPVAERLAEGRYRASLPEVAAHLAGYSGPDQAIQRRALTSSDFGDSLEAALARIIGIDYTRTADEHAPLCYDLPLKGMKAAELPELDLGQLTRTSNTGQPELLALTELQTGATVQPYTFAARFLVSRELLINDDAGVITSAVRQLGAHCGRLEAELLAGQINSNVTLADGDNLITTSNTAGTTGLDVSALDAGMALLRSNTSRANNLLNLRAAH